MGSALRRCHISRHQEAPTIGHVCHVQHAPPPPLHVNYNMYVGAAAAATTYPTLCLTPKSQCPSGCPTASQVHLLLYLEKRDLNKFKINGFLAFPSQISAPLQVMYSENHLQISVVDQVFDGMFNLYASSSSTRCLYELQIDHRNRRSTFFAPSGGLASKDGLLTSPALKGKHQKTDRA